MLQRDELTECRMNRIGDPETLWETRVRAMAKMWVLVDPQGRGRASRHVRVIGFNRVKGPRGSVRGRPCSDGDMGQPQQLTPVGEASKLTLNS